MIPHRRPVIGALLCGLIVLLSLSGTAVRAAHPGTPAPATAPKLGPYAVFQGGGIGRTSLHAYSIYLVDMQGHVVARATPHAPSCCGGGPDFLPPGAAAPTCCVMPGGLIVWPNVVSASSTRLYYLDGDTTVRYLTPAGETGVAAHVPGGPATLIGFAVSPDDRRIAVAVRTYPPLPGHPNYVDARTHLRLYVEDLGTGKHHRDIFENTANDLYSEWPVGWYHGKLLMALGPVGTQNATWTNPYYADLGYHVVDPDTGNRLATICANPSDYSARDREPSGPLSPAGTACWWHKLTSSRQVENGTLLAAHWDGSCSTFGTGAQPGFAWALSPDGSAIAGAKTITNSSGTPVNAKLVVFHPRGAESALGTSRLIPWGWLDATHLIAADSYYASNGLAVVDVRTGTRVSFSLPGAASGAYSLKGLLPTTLDAAWHSSTPTKPCP